MSEKRDLTEGKSWFHIVAISNKYLWLFIAVLAFFIWVLVDRDGWNYPTFEFWFSSGLSFLMLVILGYKGLWQKWNDLKNGRVR